MNDELLYNKIYEKTKECGRDQFIKLLMQKERENQELKNQQKEFIEWLEQNIENEKYCYLSADKNNQVRYDIFSEILSKYKEIIGSDNK